MLTEKEKLNTLTALGIELNHVQDLDILMEKILSEARRFVNADAGSIYIKEGENLRFSYTQNDTLQKREPAAKRLIYSTFSVPINEKSMAGYAGLTGKSINISNVYRIEGDKPYRFDHTFDKASNYKTESALTIPLITSRGDILGVLQIINALDERNEYIPFSAEDETVMTHFASIAAVALKRARMTRDMILRMIKMAEMRDPHETGDHVNRVGSYAVEIYEQWALKHQLPREEIDKKRDVFRMAAMLHDVGKIAISDMILQKPGKFEANEYEIMKKHTIYGAQLFQERQSEFDDAALQVALTHHEWWNGDGGYPGYVNIETGLPLDRHIQSDGRPGVRKGEEIPIFGRIVSLSDVYDALCSSRVYKEAWDEERALSTIEKASGTQFDPLIVEIFFERLDILRAIQQRFPYN